MIPISFVVDNTDAGCRLGITVTCDNVTVAQHQHITQATQIEFLLDETTNDVHVLEIEMSGKLPQHTQLDSQGNFVHDPRLIIRDFEVDQVPAQAALYNLGVYEHDCNGSESWAQHNFSGIMGCNGRVRLTIPTPILTWLLENT